MAVIELADGGNGSMASSAWAPYAPTDSEPWDLRRVVHLHRRAGFAATWQEIQRDVRDGPAASVERVLAGTARSEGMPDDFSQMAVLIGDAAVAASNADRLKAWWLYRMLFSPDPLSEKLTLMWHNHFATSNLKVDDVAAMRQQNELFREFGRGPFRELLRRVVKHPALLVWLDAEANRKEHPNENLARELMELFTLGVGNYGEPDVKEAARALTGWTVSRGQFRYVDSHHDGGEKTILGQSGPHDGDDLLDILLAWPATAARLAWRLCEAFMGERAVTTEMLSELAGGLRDHDLDTGWAVEIILRSQAFFADRNIGTRVLSPAEYVVGTVRLFEVLTPPPSTLLLAERIASMGQDLLYPPNVFGWDGGRSWINTQSVIRRGNFATAFLEGALHNPVESVDVTALAARNNCGTEPIEVLQFLSRLATGVGMSDDAIGAAMQNSSGLSAAAAARRMAASFIASPAAQLG